MDFKEIKDKYNQARKDQRNKIARFFNKHKDFETERPAARNGSLNYKSGKRLVKEYDLRNWQWICVKRNDVHFFISLQTFDKDPTTGNFHVLMDRIGIYAYVGEYSSIEAQTKMMITNIELPIDDEKLKELANMIKDLSEFEIFKLQNKFEKVRSKYKLV